jgi:hypothetical protein
VTAHFHEDGSALKGDKSGSCDGFEISIEVSSQEPREKLVKLLKLAPQACFAVDTLTRRLPPEISFFINGESVAGSRG